MYLPSFYKLQFEKYMFNAKRAGMFAIPLVLWSKFINNKFSRMVILPQLLQHPLHRLLPTSQRRPKKSRRIMILILNRKSYFCHLLLLCFVNFADDEFLFIYSLTKTCYFIKSSSNSNNLSIKQHINFLLI